MKISKPKVRNHTRGMHEVVAGSVITNQGDDCKTLVQWFRGVVGDPSLDVMLVLSPGEARTMAAGLIRGAARCEEDRAEWLLAEAERLKS